MPEINHVVLFSLDSEKFAAEFPGDEFQKAITHLRNTVPGVLSLEMNACNTKPWEGYVDCTQGYNYVLISRHTDAAALKMYDEHEVHVALRARFVKCNSRPIIRIESDIPAKL